MNGQKGFAAGAADDILYRSDVGAPFVLVCSHADGIPDSQIVIADSDGQILDFKPAFDLLPDPGLLQKVEPRMLDLTVRGVG